MQTITPCLWFDGQAEEALQFYTETFANTEILEVSRHQGRLLTATFQLDGLRLMILNGGARHSFNDAISLVVPCETQAEIDHLWARLTDGGEEGQCGWLKDRFGVSWQIVPTILPQLLSDPDPIKGQQAMQAMLQMKKLDIAGLQGVSIDS
ncbi:MAG: VOC family protein [Anaerolineae bacterium]|jgi:predicted 3-demethylubiquinone-9 3-methyltransferase (glyoxalase superfamily)|nr:VOC family protein [Anaerolineae bacterium]